MHIHLILGNRTQRPIMQIAADVTMINDFVDQRSSSSGRGSPVSDDELSFSDNDSSEGSIRNQAPTTFRNISSPGHTFRRHATRRNTEVATAPCRHPPASATAIMGLTHIRVFAQDKATHKNDDRCCSICSDRLVDGVILTRLPCGHIYHICCVLPWLNRSCTCPDCRYELPTADKKYEAGRRERMKNRKLASCGCSVFGFHTCVFPAEEN